MAEIEVKARAFWTDATGKDIAVGFAASEDPDDGYVLFEGKAGAAAGPFVEVSDEIFGADEAVERVVFDATGFALSIRAAAAAKLGMVREVRVFVEPEDADGQAALALLRRLLAPGLQAG
ncbi:MAG: hypothetical protein RIT14_2809 [Pseudomonadota bacterium]